MPVPIFIAAKNDHKLYRIGRVGYDSGDQDPGGAYVATLKSERISPAGDHGYVHFRRIGLRVLHSGTFTITMRVYVDDVQTTIYNASSTAVAQEIVFTKTAPSSATAEALLEADISAKGTFVQVELEITSTNVSGVFLPEEVELHARAIRGVIEHAAESQ